MVAKTVLTVRMPGKGRSEKGPVRKVLIVALNLQLLLSGCAARLGKRTDSQTAERLASEKGRLSALKDPIERTKSYIKISQFLLLFIGGAARDHDTDALAPLLNEYTTAVQSARDAIMNSDRDPTRRPAGFKDVEIALPQLRSLRDIAGMLSFDERAPVERAIDIVTSVREELLRLLFP